MKVASISQNNLKQLLKEVIKSKKKLSESQVIKFKEIPSPRLLEKSKTNKRRLGAETIIYAPCEAQTIVIVYMINYNN
jgi:hypothetical protein